MINDKITVTDCDNVAVGDLLIPEIIDDKVVTEIAASAFDGCIRLKSVTLPQSVTSIGEQVFLALPLLRFWLMKRIENLLVLMVYSLMKIIQTVLVSYPAGKTDITYTIPDSVTSIGKGSFGAKILMRLLFLMVLPALEVVLFIHACS